MNMGPEIKPLTQSNNSEVIAVNGTATIYTKSFSLKYAEFFSIWYKATSEGTVNIQIEIEQSHIEPSTEGSSDANWIEPEGMSDIVNGLSDENAHCESFNPIALPLMRLKITGKSGNDATTTLEIKVGIAS